jgi:hypothetical protein
VSEREHTTVKLARALKAIPGVPPEMIKRATDGYYHDYLSPLATPDVQLVTDLRELADRPATPRNSRPLLRALAKAVTDGQYDASKEESEQWMRSPEAQETMAAVLAGNGGDGHGGGIWITSTRGPDEQPVCEITWGPLQCYAPVQDVRETAADLMTCAAYAEMMMTLVTQAGLPAGVVSQLATSMLAGREKRFFGAKTTMTLLPAGSSKRKQALVLLKRGSLDGELFPDEARAMALYWLAVAEATESDQLVSEALRATGVPDETQERAFAYLRELRSPARMP